MTLDLNGRYGLNPAHSDVVDACRVVAPCKALDMGCSNGRNALYLSQQGFDVTAVDHNLDAIQQLQQIAEAEGVNHLTARGYDISEAALNEDYGFISCTVTLMFLDPASIPAVLADMQAHTVPGGYNLIVCAMSTAQYPCPMPFPFTLQEGQLRNAYAGWERIKYNEDLGTMHNGAQLQFATLLARKVE